LPTLEPSGVQHRSSPEAIRWRSLLCGMVSLAYLSLILSSTSAGPEQLFHSAEAEAIQTASLLSSGAGLRPGAPGSCDGRQAGEGRCQQPGSDVGIRLGGWSSLASSKALIVAFMGRYGGRVLTSHRAALHVRMGHSEEDPYCCMPT